jgi:hypothetical protein
LSRNERFLIDGPSGLTHIRAPFTGRHRLLRYGSPIVYYLERADGRIKIGTTGNYPRRRKMLVAQHGSLSLLAWEPGGFDQELSRHREFCWDRVSYPAEWFEPSATLIKHIAALRAVCA